jgi:hypothetical protein
MHGCTRAVQAIRFAAANDLVSLNVAALVSAPKLWTLDQWPRGSIGLGARISNNERYPG